MADLKAGVIGVGYMGRNHARVYAEMEDVELVAVADMNGEYGEKLAKKFKVGFYKDYKEMLEREKPDVVSVAVPTELHKEVAIACIEKGVNVLLEKPIAKTIEEGKAILEAAKKNNVKLMVGHIERFNPAVQKLREYVTEKKLGKVYKIDVRRCGPFPVRISDVGVTVDLAVHDIDVINYLFGLDVERMSAESEQRIHQNHEDMVAALIKLKSGEVAVLNVDWLTPTKIRQLSVIGENGMCVVDYLTQVFYFYENAKHKDRFEYAESAIGVMEGDMKKVFIVKKEPLLVELEAFLDYVRGKSENPLRAEDALKALEFAQEIVEKAKK